MPRVGVFVLVFFFFGDAELWMMSVSLSRKQPFRSVDVAGWMACAVVEEGTGRSFGIRHVRTGAVSEGGQRRRCLRKGNDVGSMTWAVLIRHSNTDVYGKQVVP